MKEKAMKKYYFTSESVTEGHPDKLCDQISDAILDALLQQDEFSRCACEVTAEPGAVHIMGEITSSAVIDYEEIAREVIRNVGYTKAEYGFDDKCDITVSVHQQSGDIAMGVNNAYDDKNEIGAGDQGMMFGYACNETEEKMPLAISLAHKLTRHLAYLREKDIIPYLRPDGKSQVTVEYRQGVPARVEAVVVSAQHEPYVDIEVLRDDLYKNLIQAVIPSELMDKQTKIFINPTGRFVQGGPAADTGLTGRKIIVDTYGGYARHGGGAFSGKDATKVDRSGAYMARWLAKHIVAAGLADKCEIQISYAIGVAQPVSVFVDTFGTGKVSDHILEGWLLSCVDLRPQAIISRLGLRRPLFAKTAAYGHFGRMLFPWEQLDNDLLYQLKSMV